MKYYILFKQQKIMAYGDYKIYKSRICSNSSKIGGGGSKS